MERFVGSGLKLFVDEWKKTIEDARLVQDDRR